MSDPDIFDSNKEKVIDGVTPTDQVKDTPTPNPALVDNTSDDLLRMITNEAGEPKYKSVKDALVGLGNAQTHIPKIEADNIALRKQLETAQGELDKKDAALEALDRFAQKQDDKDDLPVIQPGLDEGAVADLVAQVLNQRDTKSKQSANLKEVTSSLRQKFGEKASEVFYNKAEELGMSREDINKLASASPKAALQLFGVEESSSINPNVSSINSDGLQPTKAPPSGQLAPSSKSVMAGATTQELSVEMRRHRDAVYEKHGIEG